MRLSFTILLILFFGYYCPAQSLVFERTFSSGGSDVGYDVIETSDGNLLIAGTFSKLNAVNNWVYDCLLIKMDKQGDTLWTRKYGGNNNDIFTSLIELPDAYMMTGSTASFSSSISTDILLMKVDKSGNELWKKTYGGSNSDQGNKIIQLSDGNLLIAGITENPGVGGRDAYIIKTDTSGNIIWDETFGGPQTDDAWDIVETADGGYLFTGGTYSFSAGTEDDGWVVKLNAQGVEQWKKTFGEPDQQDWFWAIEPAGNDEYVLSGALDVSTSPLTSGLFFIKIDGNGDLIWDKSFGLGDGYQGNDIKQLQDGGYLIGGMRLTPDRFDFLFIRTDAAGDTLWTKGFGPLQYLNRIYGLAVTSDGKYIGAGIIGLTPLSNSDLHIVAISDPLTGIATGDQGEAIKIYPNPVTGKEIYIEGMGSDAVFSLYDISGRLIQTSTITGNKVSITPDMVSGIYFYNVSTDKQEYQGKIYIE